MGKYTGTSGADTITPTTVSAGVIADPSGSKPSVGADQIYGLGGADHLDGGAGGDTISGGAGDDTIADNYLYNGGEKGPNAGNLIHGDAGNDDISIDFVDTGGANPVTNTAWGDGGNDTIEFNYYVNSQLGDGESWVGQDPAGTITLHGGAGDDTLGNRFSNTFYGQYLIYLDGTTGVFYGEAGNDTMYASSTDPDGDGSFYPGNNPDFLHGGPGNDTYWVFETKDVAIEKAGEGIDTVYANGTDYTLGPNIENLVMTYNEYGGSHGHYGTGNALDNVITGTDDNETLNGLAGNDTIYGGAAGINYSSQDIIHGGAGNDLIYGGSGIATELDGADQLYGDAGNDRIFASFGDDVLYGGTGNDTLAGQAGNDTLWGGAGNDHLGGGTGNDMLYGEDGVDALTGREGTDTLSGGAGNDRFVYEDLADSKPGAANHDTILDFAGAGAAVGDRIDLHQIDADVTKGGNQAFVFVSSTAVLKAGQLHVVAGGGTDSLVQGEVDGKAGADFEIMVHDGATKPGDWTAADFIL